MRKLLSWLDKYILEIGIAALLLFIPLYPKLPLLDVSNTWVYIRVEDLLVAALVGVWLVQVWRRKNTWKVPLTIPIIVYWLVGGVSVLFSLLFLKNKLANFFPHLAVLHLLRRIEYMIVFFIAASTIKNINRVKRYLITAAVALAGVCLYGFGQKFFGLPAFLTMNEEFAKGIPLHLPETARISSTFAGHYDLAAYLVLAIALFSSLIFSLKKNLHRVLLFLLVFASFFLLLLTASRISFGVYLVAISLVLYLQRKKWLIIPVVLISVFLMSYLTGAGRFGKTFRIEEVVYDVKTGKPIAAVEKEEEQPLIEEDLPLGTGFISLPIVETKPPEATQVALVRKSLRTASRSAEIATISGQFLIRRAIVYDISFTTRFQGTWPRAYKAFQRNPLLGSGYSSIDVGTDNSYLRALGETGLLGFFAFLGLFFSLGLLAKQALAKINAPLGRSLVIGLTAGVSGLMLNAVLIDVFEASKVAFNLWILLGITAGTISLFLPKRRPLIKEAMEVINWPFVPLAFLAFLTFLVSLSGLANYFVGDDFTWLKWAATSSQKDISQFFLSAEGFFYRPLAKTYFLLVKPFFGLNPDGYHLFSFGLHFGCVLGAYLLVLRLTRKKLIALISSLFLLIHPVNGESVFWISSTSILLARFFYLWGFLAYLSWRDSRKKGKPVFYLIAFSAFLLGLFSHELMVTFPLLIIFYDLVFGQFVKTKGWFKRVIFYLPFGLLVGEYLWLRSGAQAHGLSGDYSYNFKYLAFNFAGNLTGYVGELLASFYFLPIYDLARSFLRENKLIAVGFLIVGLFLMRVVLGRLKLSKIAVFSVGWLVILLLPFLGLGNIAERYVYLANLGVFILIGLLTNWIYQKLKKRNPRLGLLVVSLIFGLLAGFYNRELAKTKEEWRQAGEITNKTLLALGSNYESFPEESTLYFINLPIRLSRAWVFPVGLREGLWFIYRDETLEIKRANDLEATLELTEGQPNTFIFLYEDQELKEVKR